MVKVEDLISSKEVSLLKKENIKFQKKNLKLKIGKNFNYVNNPRKVSSLHRLEKYKSLYFYKLAKNKKIKNLAEKLLGKQARLLSIQFFFKNKKENKPTPPHQDNAYWCRKNGKGLSLWIPLNKTGPKNGSLYYYEKSHKKDVKHYPSSETPGSSLIIKKINKNLKKTHFKLNSGDCVIHDSKIIHGSYKNIENKNRSAFIICFVSKKSKQDKTKKIIYERNLIKVNKQRQKKLN